MTRRKVWAVSSGSYSDYEVAMLFDREADARASADQWNLLDGRRGYDVEEFEISDEPVRQTMEYTHAINGDRDWACGRPTVDPIGETTSFTPENRNGRFWPHVTATATTPERARKAAFDRLAEEMARREGIA